MRTNESELMMSVLMIRCDRPTRRMKTSAMKRVDGRIRLTIRPKFMALLSSLGGATLDISDNVQPSMAVMLAMMTSDPTIYCITPRDQS